MRKIELNLPLKVKNNYILVDARGSQVCETWSSELAIKLCEAVNASRDVGRDQRRYQWLRDNFSYDDEVGVWSLSWSSPDPLFAASLDWQMIKDAACAVESEKGNG